MRINIVYNLTSWGYQDCFAQKDDGAYGGVLTRLLYRALPEYYPARSSYARFPFIVPDVMRKYLAKLVDSPVGKYNFTRPKPISVVVKGDYHHVRAILSNTEEFPRRSINKLSSLTGNAKLDIRIVSTYICIS